jgi:nucleoside phosphorylase
MTALMAAKNSCDWVVGITSLGLRQVCDERLSLAKSGAAVVDMESYPIAAVAAKVGIPVAILRGCVGLDGSMSCRTSIVH